jgi:RimJ/RimL family protein N-acetyltransferase
MIEIIPLDRQNDLHLQTMYTVRTHPKVAACLTTSPPTNYSQHLHYLRNIAPNKPFFIITADQIPCGYCQITDKDPIELGWALHPDWWGKSIGSAAVQLLLAYVQQTYPHKSLCLFVKRDNLAALHIYKKYGFSIQSFDSEKNEYFMTL